MTESEKLNGWIDIKDRLPQHNDEVLIAWYQETVNGNYYWTYDMAYCRLADKVFTGWRDYPEATHWKEFTRIENRRSVAVAVAPAETEGKE